MALTPVPYCDLGREARALYSQLLEATGRVYQSGRFLYGEQLEAFEAEIAAWHGVKYAVGVASGTAAVELALRACYVGSTDSRCGVTAFTAVPTINAIEAAGLTPVLHDVMPDTRNASGASDVVVHLFGLAAETVTELCEVEDVAHSMGANVGGKLAGTMGRCGALSFYPSKILGAGGDGGCVITNDPVIAERVVRMRHYGFEENGDVLLRGQNSRLSEVQAAILRVKLPYVHDWIDKRRAIAARYSAELAGRVTVPFEPVGSKHVFHVYAVQHPERDRLAAGLRERGIFTMVHYPRAIHQYERWRQLGPADWENRCRRCGWTLVKSPKDGCVPGNCSYRGEKETLPHYPGEFPNAEHLAATVLSLPLYPFLREDEQDAVIAAVKDLT